MARPDAAAPSRIRSPERADLLLALAAGLELQFELFFADGPAGELLLARADLLLLAAAIALRRRAPIVAVGLAVVAFVALEQLEISDDELVGPFFALLFVNYSLGANTHGRRLAVGVALMLAGGALAIRLDDPPGGPDDFVFLATIILGGPVLLGRLVRDRSRLGRALSDKAAALEEERTVRSAAAVSEERARIAGELHQMVSTALASMVDESEAAERLARTDPDAAEAALEAIETTGRDALGEIRLLLGVLRREDDEAALEPLPSLSHLAELVARMRASGLPVELSVEGEPPVLPAGLDLTAYRVVQEALAEALAAGAGRSATVRLRYGERELLLDVTDDGADARAAARGLLGIHERVALYGGELVAEPIGGGGHAVRARLPLERAR
jgi:signal transduction histidine kinase